MIVRRPCRARTDDLLAENQVSFADSSNGPWSRQRAGSLARRVPCRRAPPLTRTDSSGLHCRALPVRAGGLIAWRRRDSNPPRPPVCPMVRDRGVEPRVSRSQSERVSRLPRPGGGAPGRPMQAPAGVLLMPSTVKLRICDASGRGRDEKQGRQDSNLRPSVLETGALPVELRPYEVVPVTRKPPYPCRGGRLRSLRWRYSRRHPGFQFDSLAHRSWARPIGSSTTPPRGMNRVVSV